MNYKNILIIKLSAIGDVIHALPVSRALKQCMPDAKITWIVEKPAFDLLTNNPDIDEIILFDKPKFKSWQSAIAHAPDFVKMLRAHHFDLVLDLQGLFKSAAIAWATGARHRYGYSNMRELSYLVSRPVCGEHAQGHVVERYLDVVRGLGCRVQQPEFVINITADEAAAAQRKAEEAGLDFGRPYVVLAPGTNWQTKCWPARRFAALSDRLKADGLAAVIIGGPNERALAEEINSAAKTKPSDLVGKTTLKELAFIIKSAQAFVGGDTGTMHLAVAVGTPAVALFGPTDPGRNGPYWGKNKVMQVDRPCIKCWKRNCQYICLDKIEVSTVFVAIENIKKTQ
ncbi:MAG: lipopolysaccharide heptosyltransferase I [Negativicutes bacterium]|nr:lipopolysaccharide heptosyltransferase I [Negativicutes bacterium]